MMLDLAAVDRELDALAVRVDLGALLARPRGGARLDLDAVDVELAALVSGVALASSAQPARVARRAVPAAPRRVNAADTSAAGPSASASVALLSESALFGDESSTSLHLDLSDAYDFGDAASPSAMLPLSADSLFGVQGTPEEPPTRELGGLDFQDRGQAVTVSADLAALLEGELDPDEFGPPQPRHDLERPLAGTSADGSDAVEMALDESALEFLTDDAELGADASAHAVLPTEDAQSPSGGGENAEGESAEGGEKKGFFRKIFGK